MCPACVAGAALTVAEAVSAGGATALAIKKFWPKSIANKMHWLGSQSRKDLKFQTDEKEQS